MRSSWLLIPCTCTAPILINCGTSLSVLCPSAARSIYPSLYLLDLCLPDWLIETCIIHLRVLSVIAELSSKQWGVKQNYNQSTGVWHSTQWDMLIGCHGISNANRKVLWAFLYPLRLSRPFSHLQQLKFIGIPLLSQWCTQTTCFRKDLTALEASVSVPCAVFYLFGRPVTIWVQTRFSN